MIYKAQITNTDGAYVWKLRHIVTVRTNSRNRNRCTRVRFFSISGSGVVRGGRSDVTPLLSFFYPTRQKYNKAYGRYYSSLLITYYNTHYTEHKTIVKSNYSHSSILYFPELNAPKLIKSVIHSPTQLRLVNWGRHKSFINEDWKCTLWLGFWGRSV